MLVSLGKSVQDEPSRVPGSSSRTSNRLRVMIHKEFQLQPDGSYKEIPSTANKKVSFVNEENEDNVQGSESVPSLVYSPYFGQPESYIPVKYSPSNYDQYDDIVPQSSYNQPQYSVAPEYDDFGTSYQSSSTDYQQQPDQRSSFADTLLAGNAYPTDRNLTAEGSAKYGQYEINPLPTQQYYVDEVQPQPDYRNQFTQLPIVSNVQTINASPASTGGYNAPSNIQEILKKPSESVQSPYYSPKEQVSYYETTDGGDYGAPGGGYHQDSYGPPPVNNPIDADGYGGGNIEGHKGGYGNVGGKGNVVNEIIHTVSGVTAQKAAQFGNIVHQKGEVGSQLVNQGGRIVQSAVHQTAQKAKIVGDVLSQAPYAFTSAFGAKAQLASAAILHTTNKVGTIARVKAQVAKQAGHLIGAKGKAASAVIKATGGTAADLIVAKGKGLAKLIRSGGQTATAILDGKGHAVSHIVAVLGAGHNKGHHLGTSYGPELNLGGNGGGWGQGEYSSPSQQYGVQRNAYEELQSALKSVVQSPASSYGSPPTEQKLSSAFRSMYDSYVKNGNQVGAYSSPVEVTSDGLIASSSMQENVNRGKQSSSSSTIGDSLNKISQAFNSVANVLERFNAPKTQ
jgi:hypothetical protein